jgi:putative hydrolase of the HAD superfamily
MIKAVVFDYGGTLVRSAKPWREMKPRAMQAAFRYLRRHGLKTSYEEYLGVNDRVFDRYAVLEAAKQRDISDRLKYFDLVTELLPRAAKKKRLALATGANDSFWRVANGNFRLRENAKACLDELETMGLKLGMISNHHNSPSLMSSLRRHRIERRFNPIIVSELVKVRKPNPAIFRLCLSAMRVGSDEAVYVGDSPEFDVAGARAAGMPSIMLGKPGAGEPKPDFSVDDLAFVPRLVADMNGKQ